MKIGIKQALLEGHTPEVIVEAVHANHKNLDKRNPENKEARKLFANGLKTSKISRDSERKYGDDKEANFHDNRSRVNSQMGFPRGTDDRLGGYGSRSTAATQQPRLYQAAKQ